jgi:DNA-binding XRE family transcriptional regulator
MPVLVKTRPIKQIRVSHPIHLTFTFRKTTPRKVLNEVSSKYARYFAHSAEQSDSGEEFIRVKGSDWYRDMSKVMTPGIYLKTLREAGGHTLAEIGGMIGVSAARMCDYEAGRREISKAIAKKLSRIFLVPAEKFI